MNILEEGWVLPTNDEAHYNECIRYARSKGVTINEKDVEYEPKYGFIDIACIAFGLGSFYVTPQDKKINTETFKAMCDEYAAQNPS